MAKEGNKEDRTWVLDSLVGFLKSPLWSSTLNNFIDQVSVVFEPDVIEDNEGNVEYSTEYEKIFKDYRALVDQLITSHMFDLGISEEQFAQACEMAEGMLAEKLKQMLFEELWAAENFDVFVRLMARRNVELQLEALDILAQKYGLVYDVFVPIGSSPKHFLSEDHVMTEAIQRSLEDLEIAESGGGCLRRLSSAGNEKAIAANTSGGKIEIIADIVENEKPETIDKDTVQLDKARLVAVKNQVDRKMREALKSAVSRKAFDPNEEQEKEESDEDGDKKTSKQTTTEPTITGPTIIEPVEVNARKLSQEEIQKRTVYLREQRDKIIQARHKVRSERISKYLTKEKNNKGERPNTAGGGKEDESTEVGHKQPEGGTGLAFRKTLAARLKAEVIDRP